MSNPRTRLSWTSEKRRVTHFDVRGRGGVVLWPLRTHTHRPFVKPQWGISLATSCCSATSIIVVGHLLLTYHVHPYLASAPRPVCKAPFTCPVGVRLRALQVEEERPRTCCGVVEHEDNTESLYSYVGVVPLREVFRDQLYFRSSEGDLGFRSIAEGVINKERMTMIVECLVSVLVFLCVQS
jgi:hypothetical protein